MVTDMVTEYYRPGNTVLEITSPVQMKKPVNFQKFRIEKAPEEEAITYQVSFCEDLDALWDQCNAKEKEPHVLAVREDLKIVQTIDGECRFLNFKGDDRFYAASLQKQERAYQIFFAQWVKPQLDTDTIFLAPFALERQVIRDGSLILHTAFIQYNGQAVLFSAPSGVGKSTQAGLWEKYRQAEIINGDRALLIRQKDGWYASGWPVCGSSGICKNEKWPIRAIVMLGQDKKNQAERLRGMQAFREIMPQITINRWDRKMQDAAFDAVERLLQEVPICKFRCNISEEAVECLEKHLAEMNP